MANGEIKCYQHVQRYGLQPLKTLDLRAAATPIIPVVSGRSAETPMDTRVKALIPSNPNTDRGLSEHSAKNYGWGCPQINSPTRAPAYSISVKGEIMATRSYIGILNEDGSVQYVYCHFNGSPDSVGATLFKYYNTSEKVRELISNGGISVLGDSLDSTCFYHRDKDGNWENEKPMTAGCSYYFGKEVDKNVSFGYLFDGEGVEEEAGWSVFGMQSVLLRSLLGEESSIVDELREQLSKATAKIDVLLDIIKTD